MAVTEIACMGIKPGLNIKDDTTKEGQILHGTWQAVLSLPGGPSRVYWGLEVEDQSKIWAFFDWESVEEHEKFAAVYGVEATKHLVEILSHGEFTKHVSLDPHPPMALSSTVTQAVLVYFASGISPEEKNKAASELKLHIQTSLEGKSEVEATNFGWGFENDFPVRGGDEGQNGALRTAFIGWSDVDACASFKEMGVWKEKIGSVEGIEGVVKVVDLRIRAKNLRRNN